jgi:hypothetical protein
MHVRCSFVVPYFVEGMPGAGTALGGYDAENTGAQQRNGKKKEGDSCRMNIVCVAQTQFEYSTRVRCQYLAPVLLFLGYYEHKAINKMGRWSQWRLNA